MRVIFAGTPEFAVNTLKALLLSGHEVVAVYTQPDRPSGRGRKLVFSPVKIMALEHNIPIFQPVNLSSSSVQKQLSDWAPDIMIVVAYGVILPKVVLKIPKHGCLNVHASLLPRWRGAAPIQRAILGGDKFTGITIMQMDAGLDTGDILLQKSCEIMESDTSETLHLRLSDIGALALVQTLTLIEQNKLTPQSQFQEDSCYATKISKSEARIDWKESAGFLEKKIRAFNPWPVAETLYENTIIRLFKAKKINEETSKAPGTILEVNKIGLDIATGKNILRIIELQLPGAKRLLMHDILNAKPHLFRVGANFTSL